MSALLTGLLGSGHCLGMCGGIATALGSVAPAALPRPWWAILYHSGRILSYATLGSLAGRAGAAGASLGGGGAYLRLAAGALIILMGLNVMTRGTAAPRWLRAPERLGAWLWRHVQPLAAGHLPRRPVARAILTGALWGWLPCGLVYSALLAATAAGSAAGGASTMVAFGAGTLPAVAGLGALAGRLPRLLSAHSRALGLAVVACGIWTAAIPASALLTGQPYCEHPGLASH
jgi:sulfite exporter TauE/SafE